MADPHPDVRLVTISFDDTNGLEVDWDGVSAFEAWAFLWHATELVADRIASDYGNEDAETDE